MTWWKFWERGPHEKRALDYYEEGVALVRQEQYQQALTSFRLALRQRPDAAATLEQIAVVYTHIGLPDDAVKSYQRALELRPTSTSAHYGLAFLLLRRGETQTAAGHLQSFLANPPRDAEAQKWIDHARHALVEIGFPEEA